MPKMISAELQQSLAALIDDPEVRKSILGKYQGAYEIGLAVHPADRDQLAISVSVEGEDRSGIPPRIELAGVVIPILVETGFQPPEPLETAMEEASGEGERPAPATQNASGRV